MRKVDVITDGDKILGDARPLIAMADHSEPVSGRIGKRSQQHRFNKCKNGDVHADPQRKREHRSKCKARFSKHQPKSLTKVF
ncbi:MAG: hypothetical protein M3Z85_03000 [Acidobacteriota bacterium]|nr:hypothetical protein [Acidobacteriota bacterium]